MLPKGRLLSEAEWRGLGVQQSRGWVRGWGAAHTPLRRVSNAPRRHCAPCTGAWASWQQQHGSLFKEHHAPQCACLLLASCTEQHLDAQGPLAPPQVHYAIHRPEPHIMLFRRPKGYGTAQQVQIPPQQAQ